MTGMKKPVTGWQRSLVIALDRWIYALSRHWLAAFNLAVAIYVGLPFLAPVLMRTGHPGPARVIYAAYHAMCHQLGYRSWFLFGTDSNYPRGQFDQLTGIDTSVPQGLVEASAFIGNDQMGFKVALCQRDVAIWGALLLGGLLYALLRSRVPGLSLALFVILGLVPIGVDSLSQLLSQPPFNWLPFRESTWYWRTLTGGLFGMTLVGFAYPQVDESMRETREALSARFGW